MWFEITTACEFAVDVRGNSVELITIHKVRLKGKQKHLEN